MNVIKLATVCAIIETVLIFNISKAFGQTVEQYIEAELCQKFHDE